MKDLICPKCGKPATRNSAISYYQFSCYNCGIKTKLHDKLEDAIKDWNDITEKYTKKENDNSPKYTIIQMVRQKNPEHEFFIPYLNPIKATVIEKKMEVDLIDFILPDNATIMADEDGVEIIFLDGKPAKVLADIFTQKIVLMNTEGTIQEAKKSILTFNGKLKANVPV
jgi:hypothetical protein